MHSKLFVPAYFLHAYRKLKLLFTPIYKTYSPLSLGLLISFQVVKKTPTAAARQTQDSSRPSHAPFRFAAPVSPLFPYTPLK